MASFTAYNVEPDSDSEEEIDDTKEIQVEEALKLYQNALKLHSQGPRFFEEAEKAYDALFRSEIFTYPESQSEGRRLELQDDVDSEAEDGEPESPAAGAGVADTAPSALPQILYLSYKNYGQFLLDRLARVFSQMVRSDTADSKAAERAAGTKSLEQFANALDRDETDLDLWKRTSRLGQILGSKRLARFCLEAVLSSGAEEDPSLLEGPGIEESLAREDLNGLLSSLHAVQLDERKPKGIAQLLRISRAFKNLMEPFPEIDNLPLPLPESLPETKVLAVQCSWETLGRAIANELKPEMADANELGRRVRVEFGPEERPAGPHSSVETILERRNTKQLVLSPKMGRSNPMAEQLEEGSKGTADSQPAAPSEEKSQEKENAGPVVELAEGTVAEASPLRAKLNDGESAEAATPRASLKRNSDSAGLPDATEGVRVRSKRLRARAEVVDEENDPRDLAKYYEEQLHPCLQADHALFEVCDHFLGAVGINPFMANGDSIGIGNNSFVPTADTGIQVPAADFQEALSCWDLNKSNLLLHGNGTGATVTLIGAGDDSGLTVFLEHSKPSSKQSSLEQEGLGDQDLRQLALVIDQSWMDAEMICSLWIEALLVGPGDGFLQESEELPDASHRSKYLQYAWPSTLKEVVAKLLVDQDHWIYSKLDKELSQVRRKLSYGEVQNGETASAKARLCELIQTIFELHLDIYASVTQLNSKVDQPSRLLQQNRMRRWARLANTTMATDTPLDLGTAVQRQLNLRHLWSSVICVSMIESSSRDHVLLCLRDLEANLRRSGVEAIHLPNNSAMPVISAEAAEAEVSKLTTMDFFMSVFDPNTDKPVEVIESLEPILMEFTSAQRPPKSGPVASGEQSGSSTPTACAEQEDDDDISRKQDNVQSSNSISEFLGKATLSLRLSLWHRLKTAYGAIDYPPMVFLCNIRSLDAILLELSSVAYSKESREDRTANLIVWIRNMADLVVQCADMALSHSDALLFMDGAHLNIALGACASAITIFHKFARWEDLQRVGQAQAPPQPAGGAIPYRSSLNFLRELQPKMWILFYALVRETLAQNRELFPSPVRERLRLLSVIHQSFGTREYCKLGKKGLLKFIKSELLNLGAAENNETELAQILYDLYGFKLCPETKPEEHGCTADPLDRPTALDIIHFVVLQARKMNVKDLLKSDIRAATEKMQPIIGSPKNASIHQAFNKRIIEAVLRSPINPISLYRSLKGIGGLTGMPVVADYAAVADERWYFLLGHICLAKYRSQKRTSPDTSHDLEDAIKFLKIDLQFNTEDWEAWYRLGQAYDSTTEEDVTWNADDINDPKSELISQQRQAIHCYTMAVALAVRNADESLATASKVTELYTDFGNRIYASSRPPFSMQVFSLHDYERYYNDMRRGTYKREPFPEMNEPSAWAFASKLFRRALENHPDDWQNWSTLGKCLWKLFGRPGNFSIDHRLPVNAFVRAIECVPEKRDSRHPDRDVILEPHYKLVSVVHKLVRDRHIHPEEGAQVLQISPHTRKASLNDPEDWTAFVLSVLKTLRAADKQNWHHRMVARAAHILYDENPDDITSAQAAKHELTQQIFTKTMTVQVWRPEFERPGRHFVYTTRYVRFFTKLLLQSGDRSALEALGKKVRKKQADFIEHSVVWQEICHAHLHLLRFQGNIPRCHEDTIFKTLVPYEVFTQNANRLEEWAHSEAAQGHATLDLLREGVELKKLNGSLMRAPLLDDLIADAYARIYEQVVPELVAKADEVENRERMRIDRMLMASDAGSADQAARSNTPSDQAPTTTRLKTIGRTEVRRRAEALVARPNTGPPARGRPPGPKAAAASRSVNDKGAEEAADEKPTVESAPPSLHDSADDESELTDIDDVEDDEPKDDEPKASEAVRPLFPGLKAREEPGSDVEASQEVQSNDGDDAEVEEKEAGSKDVEMTET